MGVMQVHRANSAIRAGFDVLATRVDAIDQYGKSRSTQLIRRLTAILGQ